MSNRPPRGMKSVPITDPTENVRQIVKQATRRQDDLRRVEFRSVRKEVRLEVKSIHHEIKDFKQYLKKINDAEAKRIDAIRAVDVGNVAVANTAAENRASTLAGQVSDAKDAQLVALKAETDPIRKSIDDLRQSQWTIAGGREQTVETKHETQAKSSNTGLWIGIGAAIVFGLSTMLFNLLLVAITLYLGLRTP